jgi:DNA-binding MarR family transcriptional regulator/YHS domain-containing protein
VQDPVCGMELLPPQAAATSLWAGQTYYFCARTCKERFDKAPEQYLRTDQVFPAYASTLHTALRMLSKVFYGPTTLSSLSRSLTALEWDVMHCLGLGGETRMRALADTCDIALSTLTGIIDRLVAQGLVQRRHSTTDRRVVLVRLTGRGKLAHDERLDADMRLVFTMLQPLTPVEQHTLVHLAQKIVTALSEVAPALSPEPSTAPGRRTADGNATA